MFAVVAAHAAFAGVMGKVAELGALVQRANGVGRQRAIAHGRDVEHGCRVGLRAFGPADRGAEGLRRRVLRRHRMMQPLVMIAIDVVMGAERPRVELLLGALIDEGALVAREGRAVLLRLEEILAKLRPDMLEDEADVRRDRIVAQDRVARLHQIANTEKDQGAEDGERQSESGQRVGVPQANRRERKGCQNRDGEKDVARREGQQQITHQRSLAELRKDSVPENAAILGVVRCQFYKGRGAFQHRKHLSHNCNIPALSWPGSESECQPSRSPLPAMPRKRRRSPWPAWFLPIASTPMDRRNSSMSSSRRRQMAAGSGSISTSPIRVPANSWPPHPSFPRRRGRFSSLPTSISSCKGAKPAFTVSSPISSVG